MMEDNSGNHNNIAVRILRLGNKYIDYRMGIAGSIFMASVVFYINYHGIQDSAGATTAALKQGTYTFFFGGLIMRMCESIATGLAKRTGALTAACIIPSLVAISLTYGVHSMKGTPKPLESTIPTIILVIPTTLIWGIIKRRKYDKQKAEIT